MTQVQPPRSARPDSDSGPDQPAKIDPDSAELQLTCPATKRDPESLELRARSGRVVRFRRGLLIASAAGLATAIAAVAWFALQPIGLQMAAPAPELHLADNGASPEELERLPRSYGDAGEIVPELGPPLPGDLGRPILQHQRAMATEDGAAPADATMPDARAQAAEAERQARLAELAQARGAPVLMQVSGNAARAPAQGEPDVSIEGPGSGASASRGKARDDGVGSARLHPAASRWQLSAGSVISASLLTGLNSDLPGMVVAQVTEPAFDSATGSTVLVPQGARLLGRYDSKVAFGQRRAMIVWERLVMPDGSSLALDDAPATDAAGYSGVADAVDFHTWQLLRGIGMSTLFGIGTELTFGAGEGDLVRALRESIQGNTNRAAQKIVERNLDIAPTITVRPGFPVRVLVHKDLVLPPWRK